MRRANAQAVVAEQLRNDMLLRREMVSARPSKKLQFGGGGGFVWRPRLPSLRKQASFKSPDAVSTVYTDASCLNCSGAVPGDRFNQSKWPKMGLREGINWEELWVLESASELRGEYLAGKLVLVRMDDSAAVSYANYGAGKVPRLTRLARSIHELVVPLCCAAVALHIACNRNSIADALPRFFHSGPRFGSVPTKRVAP